MRVQLSIKVAMTNPISSGLGEVVKVAKELDNLGIEYCMRHVSDGYWVDLQCEEFETNSQLSRVISNARNNPAVTELHWERSATKVQSSPAAKLRESTKPIKEVGLEARVSKLLFDSGVLTLGDLLATSMDQLQSIPGMGVMAQRRIHQLLNDLGVELPVWPGLSLDSSLREENIYYLPGLPLRLFHALRRNRVNAIAQLIEFSLDDLAGLVGVGGEGAMEIRQLLVQQRLAPEIEDPSLILIECLELGARAYNLLNRAGAKTLKDLLDLGGNLNEIDGMNETLQLEVVEAVRKTGYNLNLDD